MRAIAACSLVLALTAPATAQHTLDASEVYPISAPLKQGGTFHVGQRRWISSSANALAPASQLVIYNNTCTWSGGALYTGTGSCEDYIDEGEVPGPDNPAAPIGATSDNFVTLFQFGYCTNFAVPDIKIGFYDNLGGDCINSVPLGQTHPLASLACPSTAGPMNPNGKAYYDLSAIGLPGGATPGGAGITCWLMGIALGNNAGFCLASEGDNVWNNTGALDRFNWSFSMNNPLVVGTAVSGIVISGEPSAGPFGSCTYNLPCGGGISGAPCGTGLGATDSFWINVDRDPPATPNTGATCVSAPVVGTGCYWFGGYPGNPFSSFYMVMISSGECGGCTGDLQTYCAQLAPTVTQGCTSSVATVGIPSASSATPFTVTFAGLNAGVNAVLTYGIGGPTALPWSPESRICVRSPIQRLGLFNTGGSAACSGSYVTNLNAVFQGPGLLGTPAVVGQRFNLQMLQRDPASSQTINYSQALQMVMCQ